MRAPVICTGFNMQLGGEKLEVTTLSLRRETRRVTTLSLRREKRSHYYFRIDREMKKFLSFCVCDERQKLLRNKFKKKYDTNINSVATTNYIILPTKVFSSRSTPHINRSKETSPHQAMMRYKLTQPPSRVGGRPRI